MWCMYLKCQIIKKNIGQNINVCQLFWQKIIPLLLHVNYRTIRLVRIFIRRINIEDKKFPTIKIKYCLGNFHCNCYCNLVFGVTPNVF